MVQPRAVMDWYCACPELKFRVPIWQQRGFPRYKSLAAELHARALLSIGRASSAQRAHGYHLRADPTQLNCRLNGQSKDPQSDRIEAASVGGFFAFRNNHELRVPSSPELRQWSSIVRLKSPPRVRLSRGISTRGISWLAKQPKSFDPETVNSLEGDPRRCVGLPSARAASHDAEDRAGRTHAQIRSSGRA